MLAIEHYLGEPALAADRVRILRRKISFTRGCAGAEATRHKFPADRH